ncbi:MAG: PhzF family phenazine biosynthesis protein [Rhodospirillales bacterium]|jgi:PhzF family phenazine biosynthesis protein|nr:PhzF family phenazine biosynthesis protein [Rhodospirillales bacterium]
MNRIPIYQVDAFTSELFGGNPAAVCPLDKWLADDVLQSIAMENNLSETAYIVPGGENGEDYALRWFTPAIEVDLCGHATLASSFVIFEKLNSSLKAVSFSTRSGRLDVSRSDGGELVLDFPALPPVAVPILDGLEKAIGVVPINLYRAQDNEGKFLAELANETEVRNLDPDMEYIASMAGDGLIVTALGDDEDCDFVSRYFAPHVGILEDPVTGSAHCVSVPYWANRLGKTVLSARQISKRGGALQCELDGARVKIGGRAVLYMVGEIMV